MGSMRDAVHACGLTFFWDRLKNIGETLLFRKVGFQHRVGRALSIFSRLSELRLPQLLTRRRVSPTPLWFRGRGTLTCGRGVGGVPSPTRGHTQWYSLYTVYVLCDFQPTFRQRSRTLPPGYAVTSRTKRPNIILLEDFHIIDGVIGGSHHDTK